MNKFSLVHCLKCDDVFKELQGKFIKTCPTCKNTDTKETVYLDTDNDMYQLPEFTK